MSKKYIYIHISPSATEAEMFRSYVWNFVRLFSGNLSRATFFSSRGFKHLVQSWHGGDFIDLCRGIKP